MRRVAEQKGGSSVFPHTENRTRVSARSDFGLEFLNSFYEDDAGSGCSMSCAEILEHSIDNTISTWFLAPTDCSKISAQKSGEIHICESWSNEIIQCRPFNWR